MLILYCIVHLCQYLSSSVCKMSGETGITISLKNLTEELKISHREF